MKYHFCDKHTNIFSDALLTFNLKGEKNKNKKSQLQNLSNALKIYFNAVNSGITKMSK